MAQKADGTIYIDTAIETDGFKAGGKEVEAAARRMAKTVSNIGATAKIALQKQVDTFIKSNQQIAQQEHKLDALKEKFKELSGQKVATKEFAELDKELNKLGADYDKIAEKQQRYIEGGGKEGSPTYKRLDAQLNEIDAKQDRVIAKMKQLEGSGIAYTTPDTSDLEQKIAAEEQKLLQMQTALGTSYESLKEKVKSYGGVTGSVADIGDSLSKSMKRLTTGAKRSASAMLGLNKQTKNTRMSMGRMLAMSLLFSTVFRALSMVTNGIKEGMQNLAQYSGRTNASISSLMSSLTLLKNSFATAFAPILNVVAPALTTFINMISKAVTYVGMLIAALTGQKSFDKAIGVQQDYAASFGDSASAAQEAAKASDDYLSGLDEVRRFETNDSGNGSGGSGGGAGGGLSPEDMFETVPIDSKINDIADKIKSVFSKIFTPFKDAWEREGKNTIEAAKYAFSGLGGLAQSVGRSMLEVWTNGTGTQILSTMLQIAQNVFNTIGNIATRLEEAWNTNEVGTRIVQNLANAFQSVLDFINRITESTAEWAKNIDFYPLLEAIASLTGALAPLIDTIGNVLGNIYETIILPMLTFLIETALPWILERISDLFTFISENQWIIELFGSVLIGAFAAAKIVPLILGIVGAIGKINMTVKGAIALFTGSGGLIGGIKALATALGSGGVLAIAIAAAVTVLVLLVTHWDEVKEAMRKFDTWLQGVFSHDFTEEFGLFGEIINGFLSTVSGVWDAIKQVFGGFITFLDGVFSMDLSKIAEGIVQIFSGIFNGIVSVLNAPVNLVISLLNGLLSGIQAMQNGIADALNGLSIDMPKWLEELTGYSSIGFNVGYWQAQKIPYLATGAVIPPNAPFAAVLGDQKHGNNIEAPEDLIRKIVREETGSRQQGNAQYTFIGQLNRRVLFEEIIDEAKMQQIASGENPFELL